MTAVVYRLFDADDRLIYIGATSNLAQRLDAHRTQVWWWALVARVTVEPHDDMPSAFDAEWAAIAGESPAFNLAKRRGRPSSRPHHLADEDLRVCLDWLHSKGGHGGLSMPLYWVYELYRAQAAA